MLVLIEKFNEMNESLTKKKREDENNEKYPDLKEIKRGMRKYYELLLCQQISQLRFSGQIPRIQITKTDLKGNRDSEQN